jgi:hypothetical protein
LHSTKLSKLTEHTLKIKIQYIIFKHLNKISKVEN